MDLQRMMRRFVRTGMGTVVVLGLSSALGAQVQSDNTVTAITEPSKRAEMSFPSYGIIDEVAVKEGDAIKTGQLLMRQDDEIDKLEFERLTAEAESNARLAAAEADLGVKKKKYERYKAGGDAYNIAEIEEAELEVTFRIEQVNIAKLEAGTNKIKARQQGVKVDRMSLKAEFDGIVERIDMSEGEVSDPQKPAIFVVKNDPMHIVIRHLPTAQVARLKVGDSLQVKYPDETEWKSAKIWFIAPVADATADTQVVKLEMPNPSNRATGLAIQVKLPDGVAAAQDAAGQTAANR